MNPRPFGNTYPNPLAGAAAGNNTQHDQQEPRRTPSLMPRFFNAPLREAGDAERGNSEGTIAGIARLVKEAESKWKKEAESARAHAGALKAQLLKVIRQQRNSQKEVQEAQTQLSQMSESLTRAEAECSTLASQVAAKDESIVKLTENNAKLSKKLSASSAESKKHRRRARHLEKIYQGILEAFRLPHSDTDEDNDEVTRAPGSDAGGPVRKRAKREGSIPHDLRVWEAEEGEVDCGVDTTMSGETGEYQVDGGN